MLARNIALTNALRSLRGTSRKRPFISKRDFEWYVHSTVWNEYDQIPVRNKQHYVLTICHFKYLILLPKENWNASPVIWAQNQEQTGLGSGKFPPETWSGSYKYADISQQLAGLALGVNTAGNNQNGRRRRDWHADTLPEKLQWEQLHCSENASQLAGKRIMSVLKDFPAVLPNKPGNAHYRYLETKEPIILSPFS